jgi:hypothetical protein
MVNRQLLWRRLAAASDENARYLRFCQLGSGSAEPRRIATEPPGTPMVSRGGSVSQGVACQLFRPERCPCVPPLKRLAFGSAGAYSAGCVASTRGALIGRGTDIGQMDITAPHRSRPSAVFGPVLLPPCSRQQPLTVASRSSPLSGRLVPFYG